MASELGSHSAHHCKGISKAIEQLAERTGVSPHAVCLALATNAAVRLEKEHGTEAAYRTLCTAAAAVMRTAQPDSPAVRKH